MVTTTPLPRELRDLIESGPLAHLTTISADGTPQVTVIWIGLDGDEIVSGHMMRQLKHRNIERDPRVVLSFVAPRVPGHLLECVRGSARGTAVYHARRERGTCSTVLTKRIGVREPVAGAEA